VTRLRNIWPPVAFGAIFLALWEGGVRIFDIDEFLLPRPTAIASALGREWSPEVGNGRLTTLREAGWETAKVAIIGLILGVVLGALLALVTSRFRFARESFTPLAVAVNATPIVALAPIFNAWFGITGILSNVAVVVVVVFFPIFINTSRGLKEVHPNQLELMRSYAASDLTTLREVRIPNAMPFFTTALRVAAPLSVIAAIVAEYFGGPINRLGPVITQNASFARYDNAWAAIVVASVVGLLLFLAAIGLERLLMPWRRPTTDDALS
jgi:NitT/TauT family transport system permease protein